MVIKTLNRNLEKVRSLNPIDAFNEDVINFFARLSRKILSSSVSKEYPDLASFGFFCRKRNLEKLKNDYQQEKNILIGRGLVVHFTPSNVPLNFAYSLVAASLAGNHSIIRLSSTRFEQADVFIRLLNDNFKDQKNKLPKESINIVRYEKNDDITAEITSWADVRVIWGSDTTIDKLRESHLPARAYDITFANRFSFCVVDAEYYCNLNLDEKLASDFYNDTLFYDQNACTSPRLIYWLGKEEFVEKAKRRFWEAYSREIERRGYLNRGNLSIDKLMTAFKAANLLDAKLHELGGEITRISLKSIPEIISDYSVPGGLFLEIQSEDLEMLKAYSSKKLQTITYIAESNNLIKVGLDNLKLCGIERVVKNGQASNFELVWDGYDLITSMCKTVALR